MSEFLTFKNFSIYFIPLPHFRWNFLISHFLIFKTFPSISYHYLVLDGTSLFHIFLFSKFSIYFVPLPYFRWSFLVSSIFVFLFFPSILHHYLILDGASLFRQFLFSKIFHLFCTTTSF